MITVRNDATGEERVLPRLDNVLPIAFPTGFVVTTFAVNCTTCQTTIPSSQMAGYASALTARCTELRFLAPCVTCGLAVRGQVRFYDDGRVMSRSAGGWITSALPELSWWQRLWQRLRGPIARTVRLSHRPRPKSKPVQ